MAEIVLAAGTGHGPMLLLPPHLWMARAMDEMGNSRPALNTLDGRVLTYQELLEEVGPRFPDQPNLASFESKEAECSAHVARTKQSLQACRPDALLLIGNDQDELFDASNVPAFGIHVGETLTTLKRDTTGFPEWRRHITRGFGLDEPHTFPGAPELARPLVRSLVDQGFDVSIQGNTPAPEKNGYGHAFGYVAQTIFDGDPPPLIAVSVNTWTSLNTPTAARCLAFGRALRQAVATLPSGIRLAAVATGGLSHFLCEEAFDREIMHHFESGDYDALGRLPEEALSSGTSEVRSWIVLAGLLEGLTLDWSAYVPVPRTPVGSGQGFGWAVWRNAGARPE